MHKCGQMLITGLLFFVAGMCNEARAQAAPAQAAEICDWEHRCSQTSRG